MKKSSLPLVSVLIPAFKTPYFTEALESALNQTYPNIEVIIGDDSTTNEIEALVSPYAQKYQNVKYYRNEGDIVSNYHNLFNLALGEYVNYLHDDDLFHNQKIEKMIEYMREDEEIALVTSHRQTIDKDGCPIPYVEAFNRMFLETEICSGEELINLAISAHANKIGEPPAVLFRKRDLTHNFGMYKGRQYLMLMDLATWASLLRKRKGVYISETLSYYRVHENQNTNQSKFINRHEWFDLITSAKEEGYLETDELYKSALRAYYTIVKPISERQPYQKLVEEVEYIENIVL